MIFEIIFLLLLKLNFKIITVTVGTLTSSTVGISASIGVTDACITC